MPLITINTEPSAEQKTAINEALKNIEENEPYKASLTDEDKNNHPTTAAERYPYVVKAVRDLAPLWVNKMAPDIAAELPLAVTSLNVMETYRPIISQLYMLLEYFTDGNHIAGHQCYMFLKHFYGEAQGLKARGIPGADALVAELAPLFEKHSSAQGQSPA